MIEKYRSPNWESVLDVWNNLDVPNVDIITFDFKHHYPALPWLEKETGSILTPVQAKAQEHRDQTRLALQNDYDCFFLIANDHAFTNPDAGNDNSKGAAYNARADRRSWKAMQDFFAEIFAS